MSKHSLSWRWDRMRAMTPAEIAWRASEELRARWEAMSAGRERYRSWGAPAGKELAAALRTSLAPLTPPAAWRRAFRDGFPAHHERLGRRVRAARDGRVLLFAREFTVGAPPDWHLDPASRARAPQAAAARVDYRDPGSVGSARRIWELNRHPHLVEAAQWAWLAEDR